MSIQSYPRLKIDEIADPILRENFRTLQEYFQKDTNLQGFEHFEIEFEAAVVNFKFPHNLRFTPQDIVQTSKIGAGTVTYNYSSFDSTNLDITTTGAATIRFYAGTHIRGAL